MPDQTQAAYGLQSVLRILSTPAGAEALKDQPLKGQSLTVVGTYTCCVDTSGLSDVEAHIKASAVSGTVTPAFFSVYADGTTSKTVSTPAGAALVAGTQQDLVISGLRGTRKALFTLTLGAGATCTISVGEANGL